jgi:hypothetical protein
MAQKLVQIQFKLCCSGAEYQQAVTPLAQSIADAAGLQWKIWLLNEAQREAGGIYLFADESSARAYLDGAVLARLTAHPLIGNASVTQFDVIEALTTISRGPIAEYARGL